MENFKRNKIRKVKNNRVFKVVSFIILSIYTFLLLYLLFWVFITAFKGTYEFSDNYLGLPKKWTFQNFVDAFNQYVPIGTKKVYMEEMLLNSFIYTLLYSTVPLFACTCVAYICAKYPSKFGKLLQSLVLFFMVFPVIGSLSGALEMSMKIGTYDNIWRAILLQFNFGGSSFLVLYGVFKSIPKDYIEAAQIDGAGHYRIMFSIMFPMAANVITAYFITNIIGCWNDWNTPLVWFPSSPTVAYGLYRFSSNGTGNTIAGVPAQCAACIIAAVPMIIMFIVFQKKIIGNISIGGIKG